MKHPSVSIDLDEMSASETGGITHGPRVVPEGEPHGQADHVKKQHYYLILTENTKYDLRVANPWTAGWPPSGRIIMTP
jgi:hypothetical protein